MEKNKMVTVRITTNAMLAALCAVFGYLAIDLHYIKFTLESLPVLVAALLFGPVDGLLVGGIGTFIYQVLRYGIDPSTPLWIIPYAVIGFACGLYAMKYHYYNTRKQLYLIITLMEVLLFALNTVGLYLYAGIIGKSGMEYVLTGLPTRSVVCVLKSVGFSMLIPVLLKALHRFKRDNFARDGLTQED